MSKKIEFNISDYDFKIVKLKIYTGNKNNPDNKINYYLLVDDSNFIHDYKVEFEQINITRFTTPSHKNDHSFRIALRKELLKKLGLTHSFEEQTNKEYILFSYEKILDKNINNFFYKTDMRDITFQNIEYLLRGSNPSGQGNSRGYFKTSWGNDEYAFGFFLKTLNISSRVSYLYNSVDYSEIWNNFENDKNKFEEFGEWVSKNSLLRKHFQLFKWDSHNWKFIRKTFEDELNKKIEWWKYLENKIIKLRQEQKDNIKKIMSEETHENMLLKSKEIKYKKYLFKKYFDIDDSPTTFEYAHIKPVYKIKEEFKNSKEQNQKILDQVSDPYNFLPLPDNVHRIYDLHYFYWNENGKIEFCQKEGLNTNDLDKYTEISKDVLENVKPFLKEYYKKIIEKN